MKTFITAEDIETLAAQGVHELTVDEDTVLTAVAREAAAQRGIRLVAPGANKPGFSTAGEAGAEPGLAPAAVSGKPKGCQHGPLSAGGGAPRSAAAAGSPVVDELIGAVKQMARVQSTR